MRDRRQTSKGEGAATSATGEIALVARVAARDRALLALHLGAAGSEERRNVVVGPRAQRTLDVAGKVARVLAREKLDVAAIGAAALAVHGFVRASRGVDLGVRVPASLPVGRIAAAVRGADLAAELSAPPRDGVGSGVRVRGEGADPVLVVCFPDPPHGRDSAAGEALHAPVALDTIPFPVVDLAHLVALKLATGDEADELDVVELLAVRPDADLRAIREVCERHGVGAGLERAVVCAGR